MSSCARGLRPTTRSAPEVRCGVQHWASACRTLARPARQLRVPKSIRHRDQRVPTGVESCVGVSFLSRPPVLGGRDPSLLHPTPPVSAARDRSAVQVQGDPRRAGPVRPPVRRVGQGVGSGAPALALPGDPAPSLRELGRVSPARGVRTASWHSGTHRGCPRQRERRGAEHSAHSGHGGVNARAALAGAAPRGGRVGPGEHGRPRGRPGGRSCRSGAGPCGHTTEPRTALPAKRRQKPHHGRAARQPGTQDPGV